MPERPSWQAQIRRSPEGSPVGAGILVTPRTVVTCAHVLSPSEEQPEQDIWVILEFVADRRPLLARVAPGGWFPASLGPTGDIAVLELVDSMVDAKPAPLAAVVGVEDHPFRALGYPRGHDGGVWSTGRIVGVAETEWLQLQAEALGYALEKGFSGAPVWDQTYRAVVGMVVSRDRLRDAADPRVGFAIPMDLVRRRWPKLGRAYTGERLLRPRRPRSQLEQLLHIHQRNLAILEQQEARYAGTAAVFLVTQLEDERAVVDDLLQQLGTDAGGAGDG